MLTSQISTQSSSHNDIFERQYDYHYERRAVLTSQISTQPSSHNDSHTDAHIILSVSMTIIMRGRKPYSHNDAQYDMSVSMTIIMKRGLC